MEITFLNNIPVYQFQNFLNFEEVFQFTSTRKGGVSNGVFGSLNLGYNTPDTSENVVENRALLQKAIGTKHLIFPKQTHTNHVEVVTKKNQYDEFEETDALITNEKGIALAVICADCVPIILYDHKKQVIAVIHAGWRGTVGRIVQNTVQKMTEVYGSNPQNIWAGIAPSISKEAYEVGEEVIQIVKETIGEDVFYAKDNEKYLLDLWEANKKVLIESGIPYHQIEIAEICTYQSSDTFFSYRHCSDTGRFATGIVLK
ncbi:MAG: peptidoglycan editing factor PgeF [Cytophagales bacterium]|nr:peptidoglycan editing factor PgeF [Cytophagales bacterium]